VEGLGISGMRERVSLFWGSLALESQPGRGTAVQVRIPMKRGGGNT
jgi:signal transduction histidine kinase